MIVSSLASKSWVNCLLSLIHLWLWALKPVNLQTLCHHAFHGVYTELRVHSVKMFKCLENQRKEHAGVISEECRPNYQMPIPQFSEISKWSELIFNCSTDGSLHCSLCCELRVIYSVLNYQLFKDTYIVLFDSSSLYTVPEPAINMERRDGGSTGVTHF